MIVVIAGVDAILGALAGWLGPQVVKAERPMGMNGDIIVAVAVTVIVGVLGWLVMPSLGFTGVMRVLGSTVDPVVVALIALWLVRKIKE